MRAMRGGDQEAVSSVFVGDTLVPDMEQDHILLLGRRSYESHIIFLGSTTPKSYSQVLPEDF